jgi:hypothetical protein
MGHWRQTMDIRALNEILYGLYIYILYYIIYTVFHLKPVRLHGEIKKELCFV